MTGGNNANDNHIYIASVVATYWFVSISMVYLNKVLMSNEGLSIPAPLFVTWYQCVVTGVICWIAGKIGESARNRHASRVSYTKVNQDEEGTSSSGGGEEVPKSFFTQFPKATYDLSIGRRIFPLSLVFVGMITFNNLCLKWVEVSFYNVARSLTIVFNVFFSFCLLGIPSSPRTILCLLIVIFGFLIGSKGELNFSVKGTLAGVMSSLFVSLNSIFTKKVLPAVDDNHWRLTFYNNVNASFLFIPLVFFFESHIIESAMDEQLQSPAFWSAMNIAGIFGFSIGIVTVLQIKATSPLSHNISGTAKAALQSMLAFWIWGNKTTFLAILGIFTVLGGSLLYTIVKMNEGRAASSSPPSAPSSPSRGLESSSSEMVVSSNDSGGNKGSGSV